MRDAMTIVPEIAWEMPCLLGEGPAWFAADQSVRFVDIKRGELHRLDPATGARETTSVGGNPGFILPIEGGGAVVGNGHHLSRFSGASPAEMIASVAMPSHNRINDAALSPTGELWFGTMDDEETQPTGSIYRQVNGEMRSTAFRAIVTNGPVFSPDGRLLYVADSPARRIWRFRPDEDPQLERGELFAVLGEHEGFPDGLVTDADGCLWVGLWDGWGVRCYSPEGERMFHIELPCARVTKIAFGGPDLRRAYVTTARIGLDPTALANQPLAGSLFCFDAPARGWATRAWHGF